MKEVQYDHLGMEVIHVDFARVSLDEKVEVTMPLELKGEPKGEAEGGVLQQIVSELEIECLVTEIPEEIWHNVSEMVLDTVLHIKDLKLPPGVKCMQDEDLIVATVKEIQEEVAAPAAEAEGAAEPEVIGRKKEERRSAAEGAAAAGGGEEGITREMKLVVGLGNPTVQYVGTRHNVGFEVVDALAIRLGLVKSVDEFNRLAKTKFDGLFLDGASMSGEKLLLLMPMTYMNNSGRSVQPATAFTRLRRRT